jgi:hypothetical protein
MFVNICDYFLGDVLGNRLAGAMGLQNFKAFDVNG